MNEFFSWGEIYFFNEAKKILKYMIIRQ